LAERSQHHKNHTNRIRKGAKEENQLTYIQPSIIGHFPLRTDIESSWTMSETSEQEGKCRKGTTKIELEKRNAWGLRDKQEKTR
jgi:hypothetical protein